MVLWYEAIVDGMGLSATCGMLQNWVLWGFVVLNL